KESPASAPPIDRAFHSPPSPGKPREGGKRAEPIGRAPANDPAVQRCDERDHHRERWREIAAAGEQITAHGEDEQMRDGKRGGLLRKRQGKFPNQNDGGVYEKGQRPVLVFAGKIA